MALPLWHYRYRLNGKEQLARLGKLSEVKGLAWARRKAAEARSSVEAGEHLTRAKAMRKAHKSAAAGNTFAVVRSAWQKSEARRARWTPDYRAEVNSSLANHLSELDPLPMAEITAAIAAPFLRRVERAAPDMAKKVRQRLRAIFDYAWEDGIVQANPIPAARRRSKIERKHLPAVLDRKEVGEILRAADVAEVTRGVRRAHLIVAYTVQRVGEAVGARWSELDLQAGTWAIPRERMKRKDKERGPHEVPLPPGLLVLMREWGRVDGEDATYVCAAPRGHSHVTRESIEKFSGGDSTSPAAIHRTLGARCFRPGRATPGKNGDVVEAQLDHFIGTKVAASYDRAKRLNLRRELMRWYEGQLIAARDGVKIAPLRHFA